MNMIMSSLKTKFLRFLKNRKGLSLVEYALVGALVSVASIATLTTLGAEVSGTIANLGTAMSNAKGRIPTT